MNHLKTVKTELDNRPIANAFVHKWLDGIKIYWEQFLRAFSANR